MEKTVTIREKHHFVLRWCHWLNVIFLSLMVWSGLLIYWAHQPYVTIPKELAEKIGIDHRLAEGMGWHFLIMWPFVINGLVYVTWLFMSGEWRDFLPGHSQKFHKIQGLAYLGALLLATGSVLSGIAIYKPVQVQWLANLFGGYAGARLLHFLCMVGLVFFVIVHVIQVLRAGRNNFRSMVAGYEIVRK